MENEIQNSQELKPENRDETRNPDGTFKPGISGNPGGRPKNSLKDYLKAKLSEMTAEEKEAWLIANKITGDLQWRMAEGQPQQDVVSDGKALPTPIYGGLSIQGHNSDQEDIQTKQED